jgi:hypothetical protein
MAHINALILKALTALRRQKPRLHVRTKGYRDVTGLVRGRGDKIVTQKSP